MKKRQFAIKSGIKHTRRSRSKWWKEWREKSAASRREYRAKHRKRASIYNAQYYLNNREKLAIYAAEWRLHNPERVAIIHSRRRALKVNVPINDLTVQEWKDRKAEYGDCCAYCLRPSKHLGQDHMTPLSRGGMHTLNNIVPACKSCNSRKGTQTLLEYVIANEKRAQLIANGEWEREEKL